MHIKDNPEQNKPQAPQPAPWAESESRFPTPEELDAQFDPDDDSGGGGRRRHGIGPRTVVMALAQAGFRGAINPRCLQMLVEMAVDSGVRTMVLSVYEDSGLTFIPSSKWWTWPGQLIQADDPQLGQYRETVAAGSSALDGGIEAAR